MDISTDPFLGKVIHGYRLEQLLGKGSLTAVYQAYAREQRSINTLVVTILLVPETLSPLAKIRFRARFFQVVKQLEALRHPNILPLYGYGELDGHYYLLTPDTKGETLLMQMRQKRSWTLQETLALLMPIATALEYLHNEGVIYQFFNPANILLLNNRENTAASVQLTGLGFLSILRMKGLEEGELAPYEYLKSVTGSYIGSPEYLAPEMVKGMEGDARTDIYSLGILLFVLLSGSPPFTGGSYLEIAKKHIYEPLPSLHEMAPDLPVSLELVINHALYRYPEFRFQHPNELITAYVHVINERINVSRDVHVLQKIQRTYKLAAVDVRLLPPGQKRTIDAVRSLPSPPVSADEQVIEVPEPQISETSPLLSYEPAIPQEEFASSFLPLLQEEPLLEENEEGDLEGVTDAVPKKVIAELPADASTLPDEIAPPLAEKETLLSGDSVPGRAKVGDYIQMFASELSTLASRFSFSKMPGKIKTQRHRHPRKENVSEMVDEKPPEEVDGGVKPDQHTAKDEETAQRSVESDAAVGRPETLLAIDEKVLERREPGKNEQIVPFRETHTEFITMMSQIQELRERLQKQPGEQKQEMLPSTDDVSSAKNDEKLVKEAFPDWLN